MKRLTLVGLLTLTLFFGVSLSVSVVPAHAQLPDVEDSQPSTPAAPATTAKPAAGADNPSIGKLTAPADTSSYDGIMSMLMGIFAWLVGAAAILLDGAVYHTVVTMGSYVNNLSAISTAWHILRDIGNIVLIFGFIAIGIGIIIDSGFYGGGVKMLPTLLLAAIFLNFSLFISQAVIDVGNLFATQFYTQINGGMPAGQKTFADGGVHTEGISNKIMAQIGLQTIYNVNFETNKIAFKAGNMWIVGFMSIILFLVAAFVMLSLAFVLISRFVYLIYLIIASPIGFAGLAVPKLEGFAKDWWKSLFEQTITAPILMLLLYVALLVITNPAFLTGFGIVGPKAAEGAYLSWLNGGAVGQLAGVLLSFLVAMGLLLAVVIASKKLSAFGAEAASKWGSKLTFGAAAAGTGLVWRNTGGRTATRFASKVQGYGWARSDFGRYVVGGLNAVGKSTGDFRNSGAVKSLGGLDFVKSAGVDFGTGVKDGFSDAEKKTIKAREDYAKSLKNTKSEKDQIALEKRRKEMMEQTVRDIEFQNEREMTQMLTVHGVEMEPFQDATDSARRDFNRAQRSGHQATIRRAQSALDTALRDQEEQRKRQKEMQAQLQNVHDRSIAVQKEEVNVRQREIDSISRQPQIGYATNQLALGQSIFYKNRTTAANVYKNAEKRKEERESDKLFELLEKAAKNDKG